MVNARVMKLRMLSSKVKNPAPAILDRMGMRRKPYTLWLRNGLGIELRPGSGDLFGFYEIVLREDYLAHGQALGTGDVVIDVGANVGCFTLLASKIVGSSGRVFAIEPEQSTYSQLVRNIEINRLKNVTPLKIAIGGSAGAITLHEDPNRLFSSIYDCVNGHEIRGRDQQVEVTTLEALMDTQGIRKCDYLKLDCEGAEHEILRTMSVDTARRISQMTMEVHKVANFDGQSLKKDLDRLQFRRVGTSNLPYYRQT